jgi:hypothetical protein
LTHPDNAVIYQYRGRGALPTAKLRDDVKQDMKPNPIEAKGFPEKKEVSLRGTKVE